MCTKGDTNEAAAKYDRDRLVGDWQAIMPLDSNLFADLETARKRNLAYTHDLLRVHPDKFLFGEADEVQKTMLRTWKFHGVSVS